MGYIRAKITRDRKIRIWCGASSAVVQEKRKKSVPHSGLREALLATTLAPAMPKLQEANATGISQNIKDVPPLEKQIPAAIEPYEDPIIDPFEIPSDPNHPPRRLG